MIKRLLLLFCIALNAAVSAWALPPDDKTVTLELKNVSMETFLDVMKQKTGANFLYNSQMFKEVPAFSVTAKDEKWKSVLGRVLEARGFDYVVKNDIVVIRKYRKTNQSYTLEGKVVDEAGAELPGVTVLIEGKTRRIGTMTDAEGGFSLGLPSEDVVVRFSFVGMQTLEIHTGKLDLSQPHTFQLKPSAEQLNEVVVTGYATINRNSFTGTSVTVSAEQLMSVSKTNVLGALQTFDPSFRIAENTRMGSNPNNIPELYIRGRSGIGTTQLDTENLSKAELKNNPNLPTFIMDGFEISVQKLYDMDPSRIASVTILKDAAATAMYGSRAANGVVVITTVAPKPGRVNVNYNFTGTLEMPDLHDYNLMNARQKLQTEVAAGLYKQDLDDPNSIKQSELDQIYNQKLNNVVRGVDTYWLSQPLRTVFNHKHSLYLDGGTHDLRWGADFSYNTGEGVMKGSYRDRMSAGFSFSYRLGSLQVRNYFSYTYTKSEESPFGSFSAYTSKLPYDEFKDQYGNYLKETTAWRTGADTENPLYEATLGNYDRSKSWELLDNFEVMWNITPYLLLKGQFSVTKSNSDSRRFYDPRSQKNELKPGLTNIVTGELNLSALNNLGWDAKATLSYNRTLKKHNLNLLVGVNALSSQGDGSDIGFRGFPSGSLSSPGYANSVPEIPSYNDSRRRLFGALGTFNYSYDNIYLADFSTRLDGNSEFGSNQRFAPFLSAGVGLNIHNYPFMKKYEFIERLKVRGTYGLTGKVNFSPYDAQTIYKVVTKDWYKTGIGASLIALGNDNLGWEKTHNMDLGLDLDMLKGLVQVAFSYYRKKTVDLVNSVTLPTSTGFSSYQDNIGEVMNKGFEINLRSTIINRKDLFVALFVNMAHNENKLLKISESLRNYNNKVRDKYKGSDEVFNKGKQEYAQTYLQYVEGGSLTSIFGVRSLGINPADGREIYLRPDGTITYDWNAADQVVIGNEEPKAQGTFGVNLRWKKFSVYSTFMYEFGGQRYNSTLIERVENARIQSANVDRRVLTGRWQHPGDRTPFSKLQVGSITTTRPTSRFVQDYNVLSFNSLTLGYDFDDAWMKKAHLGMLRLELSANDLFRVSTVKAERGLDYPYSRSFAASLRMSF